MRVPKVLLLNSYRDRETDGMDATAFALSVRRALNRGDELNHPLNAYLTHVVAAENSRVPCNPSELQVEGVHVSFCKSAQTESGPIFASAELVQHLLRCMDAHSHVQNK
jgi:hypothetical protein